MVMAAAVVMVAAPMVMMSANREERARALFRVRAGHLVAVGQELFERRLVQGAQLVLVPGLDVRLGGVWGRRCAHGPSSHVPLRRPLQCFACQPLSDHVGGTHWRYSAVLTARHPAPLAALGGMVFARAGKTWPAVPPLSKERNSDEAWAAARRAVAARAPAIETKAKRLDCKCLRNDVGEGGGGGAAAVVTELLERRLVQIDGLIEG